MLLVSTVQQNESFVHVSPPFLDFHPIQATEGAK